MGIIKAASTAVGGTLSDQWLEMYYCNSMEGDVLAAVGQKRVNTENNEYNENSEIISNGSIIVVNEGQCAFVVESGKVLAFYDNVGENVYNIGGSPSVFSKGGLKGIGKQVVNRIGYGGDAFIRQRVIYLDLKEKPDNAFTAQSHIRIKDSKTDMDIDSSVEVSGKFSFVITEPEIFYKKICGNRASTLHVGSVMPQLTTELDETINIAINNLSKNGILPSELNQHIAGLHTEITTLMNEEWQKLRGFRIFAFAIDGITVSNGDMDMLKRYQRSAAAFGKSEAQPAQAQPKAGTQNKTGLWFCPCGKMNTSNFCESCGKPRP